MRRPRRNHSPRSKPEWPLRHHKGEKTVAELAAQGRSVLRRTRHRDARGSLIECDEIFRPLPEIHD